MSHYLLSVHAGPDDRPPPTPEEMEALMARIIALEAEMDAAGAFVFGGRLHGPDASAVVRREGGDVTTTDGSAAPGDVHMAGFYIIEAADRSEALGWAAKVVDAIGAPIEVRPFAATGRAADQMQQTPER